MFAEDLSLFFATDEHAVEAAVTINGSAKTVNVIFSNQTMDVQMIDTEIVAENPNFICAAADIIGLKNHNQVVTGGKTYKVRKVTDDGTGISTVYLS